MHEEAESLAFDFDDSGGNYGYGGGGSFLIQKARGFAEKFSPVCESLSLFASAFRNEFNSSLDYIVSVIVFWPRFENYVPRMIRKDIAFVFGNQKVRPDKEHSFKIRGKTFLFDFWKHIKFTKQEFVEKLNHINKLSKYKEKYEEEENIHEKDDCLTKDSVNKIVAADIQKIMEKQTKYPKWSCTENAYEYTEQKWRLCARGRFK